MLRRLVEAGTRIVQYGYAGAEGADVAEVVDRAQAEIYEVTERRTSEDFVALEELLQPTMDEIDAIASRGGISLRRADRFAELDEVTNGLHPGQMIIVAARPGVGKALALDTPLPTPTGWTTMGDVAVGDLLLGRGTAVPTHGRRRHRGHARAGPATRSSSPTARSSSPTPQHQWSRPRHRCAHHVDARARGRGPPSTAAPHGRRALRVACPPRVGVAADGALAPASTLDSSTSAGRACRCAASRSTTPITCISPALAWCRRTTRRSGWTSCGPARSSTA